MINEYVIKLIIQWKNIKAKWYMQKMNCFWDFNSVADSELWRHLAKDPAGCVAVVVIQFAIPNLQIDASFLSSAKFVWVSIAPHWCVHFHLGRVRPVKLTGIFSDVRGGQPKPSVTSTICIFKKETQDERH